MDWKRPRSGRDDHARQRAVHLGEREGVRVATLGQSKTVGREIMVAGRRIPAMLTSDGWTIQCGAPDFFPERYLRSPLFVPPAA